MRRADCHRDRKYHAKGLCLSCYSTFKHKRRRERMTPEERRSERDRMNSSGRRWQAKAGADRHYRRTYGVTLAQYDDLANQQDGACAICRRPPAGRRLALDHCHTTNAIRGLLCTVCNMMMGSIDGDPQTVVRLLAYVKRAQYQARKRRA